MATDIRLVYFERWIYRGCIEKHQSDHDTSAQFIAGGWVGIGFA